MKNNSDFTINTSSWCIYFHVEHIQHINFQYLLSTLVILNKVILNPRELFKIEIKTLFQDICTNSNSCFTNLARDQHFKSTDTHTHARAEKFGDL